MAAFTQLIKSGTPHLRVSLNLDTRRQSRIIATAENGEQIVIAINRGLLLHNGDLLLSSDGRILEIEAAPEKVSTVTAKDSLQLTRLAYHLGNRHVPLEITEQYLRYQHDHVLDEMVLGLGGQVKSEIASFNPEEGAYSHSHA